MSTDIFKNNQNLKQVFVTSDGEKFYHKNDALNHAKNLKDKTVEPVFNPKFLEVIDEEVVAESKDETETTEAEVAEEVVAESKTETETTEAEVAEEVVAESKTETETTEAVEAKKTTTKNSK